MRVAQEQVRRWVRSADLETCGGAGSTQAGWLLLLLVVAAASNCVLAGDYTPACPGRCCRTTQCTCQGAPLLAAVLTHLVLSRGRL